MLPDDFKITTEMLWQGALIFALLDTIYVPVLVWRVKPELFRRVKWVLAMIAGLVWSEIWRWAIGNFWNTVYIYVFPAWGKHFIPIVFGLFNALIALGLWTLALRFKINPVAGYCFVGGLWGALTHMWAVYRGVVSKPPMLQGASLVAAVVIAFFEYMFYWCVILTLSALGWWGWDYWRRKRGGALRLRVSTPYLRSVQVYDGETPSTQPSAQDECQGGGQA